MPRILAIDYGLKRCGVAVTDPEKIIATGLCTQDTHQLMDFLKSYIAQEPVERILIGLPKNLDGTDTDVTERIRHYAGRLRRTFPGIPVEGVDEQYTSKMASRAMVEMGMKKKDRRNKATVDEIAAALILQEYLGIS